MPTDLLTQTFTRLRPRLKALADRLLQSQDDAEDALQEAFYRLWKRQSDDEAKIDAVRVEGLAVTTVRNLCLDNLRHASAHPQWSLDDEETHVMPVANVRTILSRSRKVVRETYMNYTRQRI